MSTYRLVIYAFKDITAFILDCLKKEHQLELDIYYVKNADEAHSGLERHEANIAFMSYDDTLSMRWQQNYSDILAFLPVHAGILDLCGTVGPTKKNKIGIDTDTGYARALRYYFRKNFLKDNDKSLLEWVFAGSTDISSVQDKKSCNPPFARDSLNILYNTFRHIVNTLCRNAAQIR
jgi:hypothetical protein